jgi:PelA/Pel-15E family pectate lyase
MVFSSWRRRALAGCLLGALAVTATAALVGINPPAPPLDLERIAALPAAERAAWADYLAASQRQKLADQAALAAERSPGQPVPPPQSGPGEATMPLNEPAAWYGGAEARAVADNILSFQTPAGGWGKNQPRDRPPRVRGQAYVAGNGSHFAATGDFDQPIDADWSYVGTIDNDATVTEIRFLARVIAQLEEAGGEPLRAAALKGIAYLLAAQFPNGGWPQVWPLQGGYHDAITLNDNAMVGVATLMGAVARGADAFGFVPAAVRAAAAAAEERAIANLLALQVRVQGRALLWAQQHDPLTLAPVSARNYEPPALCTLESAELLVYLMSLPQPSPAVVAAIDSGVAALRDLQLQGLVWGKGAGESARRLHRKAGAHFLWARFHDPVTLQAVFGDRDKTLHDDVMDISAERRNGYAWFVTGPKKALVAHDDWRRQHPHPPPPR